MLNKLLVHNLKINFPLRIIWQDICSISCYLMIQNKLPSKNYMCDYIKKCSPVHMAPACAGSGEGSDHLGLFVRILSLHFCKRLVPRLELVTS